MNYTKEMLIKHELKEWPGKAMELLIWNDNDNIQPQKLLVTGMQTGDKPWLVPLNFGDGAEEYGFQHAALIPDDWTPYKEPKEIPFFDAEIGKQYRVIGNCGMDFNRIMFCVKKNKEGQPLFGDTMDDKKCIGTAWIDHVYTC